MNSTFFTLLCAVLAFSASVTALSADAENNAQRFARGLPPVKPKNFRTKRSTAVRRQNSMAAPKTVTLNFDDLAGTPAGSVTEIPSPYMGVNIAGVYISESTNPGYIAASPDNCMDWVQNNAESVIRAPFGQYLVLNSLSCSQLSGYSSDFSVVGSLAGVQVFTTRLDCSIDRSVSNSFLTPQNVDEISFIATNTEDSEFGGFTCLDNIGLTIYTGSP